MLARSTVPTFGRPSTVAVSAVWSASTGWRSVTVTRLVRAGRRTVPADSRAASAHLAGFVEPYLTRSSAAVVEALVTAADGLDRTPAEVALAWLRGREGLSCALVGPRTPAQLRQLLGADDLTLPDELTAALDDVSAPVLGYPERLTVG